MQFFVIALCPLPLIREYNSQHQAILRTGVVTVGLPLYGGSGLTRSTVVFNVPPPFFEYLLIVKMTETDQRSQADASFDFLGARDLQNNFVGL